MKTYINEDKSIRLYNADCLEVMDKMYNRGEMVDLIVTSPPYYNAREYSFYENFTEYMKQMRSVFESAYKVLNNHKYAVINVGDITCFANKQKWSSRKFPIGAYFIVMLEEIGFRFIDDYIWDKGEPQSKRHLGNPPYPFYQYPVNCYEHIIIVAKHELDKEKTACPICNEVMCVSNSQSSIGVQSWECKNPNCKEKSISGRGKRYSKRSIMMENGKTDKNEIDKEFISKFRRDIVRINPVIKINQKGENKANHTAPFPEDIPEMAIRYYSHTEDTVLDMFMGSNTTGLVANRLSRRFVGIELDENYFNTSIKRISK